MSTRTATSTETASDGVTRRINSAGSKANGTTSTTSRPDGAERRPRKPFPKKYRHTMAIHSQEQPSILSHDAAAAPSFLGFRNLMVIVLVVGNLRLVIENMQKYGVLICIGCHDFRKWDVILGLALYFLIPCHLFAAYLIEFAAVQQAKSRRARNKKTDGERDGSTTPTEDEHEEFQSTWRIIAAAHGLNAALAVAITTFVVYFDINHPLIGTLTEMHAVVVGLKTASYALTNRDLRHAYLHPPKKRLDSSQDEDDALPELYASCPYPQNITMSNLVYFWWAPTLVYQPVYPRTEKIRWIFVAKRLGEVFCLSVFIWFCSAQYAAPVLRNSLDKIQQLDLTAIVERLLKLSTISLVIWLAGFFALFHSFLNALAELTRFADRTFYADWWNSESLGEYWRLWNKPVYQFFKRHVYAPMVGRGWNPILAMTTVFFLSAVLHEILVGVPTHNIIGVAFLGMFLQLPLIAITMPLEKMKGSHGKLIGNCIFWVSFTILGQPFAALMYFYRWQAKFGSVSKHAHVAEPNLIINPLNTCPA